MYGLTGILHHLWLHRCL